MGHDARNPSSLNKCVDQTVCLHKLLCMRGSRGRTGGSAPPWKIAKIVFLVVLVRIAWKSQSNQASIQRWAISGMPAKRHWMAFRWRADNGLLIVVFGSSLPSSPKRAKKTPNKKQTNKQTNKKNVSWQFFLFFANLKDRFSRVEAHLFTNSFRFLNLS